ncbi:DUF29 domain-containing protein [Methylobacterium trifolii]|uniref:DUF29 domain-containing protein n=1 Tax=Methylobacterium trifolii TaxID=1003092 RepID=A0ABQ4U0X8_9HYPH|nr:DUF29 domain-containing protein [Methylobacterium trifolii]GJE59495.1 hypothetical protein MPOCJGCO_1588 [Methylobacterium trifolii]
MDRASLYDDDIVTWSEEQAAAVRALGARPDLSNALDWENVAEEIESLGRSHIQAVESLLLQVMTHLIKRVSAPGSPSIRHWRAEILTFQTSALGHFSRSMRQRIDLDKMWSTAIRIAGAELIAYGNALLPNLPSRCPLRLDDLVADPFEVDAVLQTIAEATITR